MPIYIYLRWLRRDSLPHCDISPEEPKEYRIHHFLSELQWIGGGW